MNKKNKCPKCPKCLPAWLAQFGDLMSLLLVFFILLLSMSVLNEQKIVEYLAHMRQSLGVLNSNKLTQVTTITPIEKTTPMEKTSDDYQQSLNEITETLVQLNKRNKYNIEIDNDEMDIEDFALLEIGKKSFSITLPAKILFKEGEYTSNNKNIDLFIQELHRILKKVNMNDIDIEISGFASKDDRMYLNTLIHPKNLVELGFFRAEYIAGLLKKSGFLSSNIKITSYGNNRTIDYENNDKNRRVEIKLISHKFESELNKNKKSVFDKIKKMKKDGI